MRFATRAVQYRCATDQDTQSTCAGSRHVDKLVNNQANRIPRVKQPGPPAQEAAKAVSQRPFEIGTVPGHLDGGAVQRRRLIDQRKLGAGAFQKRLGDEKTKTEPEHRVVIAFSGSARLRPAVGDIGLAEPVQAPRAQIPGRRR